MVKEAEKYADEDRKEALRISSRNKVESLLYTISSTLKESSNQSMGDDNNRDDLQTLSDSVDEMMEWLDDNQNVSEREFLLSTQRLIHYRDRYYDIFMRPAVEVVMITQTT